MVRLLLDAGADATIKNSDGVTAMTIACVGGYLESAQWLFDNGAAADIRSMDVDGATTLF